MLLRYARTICVALGIGLAVGGCGGGGSNSTATQTSTLNVSLADAPMSRAGVQSVFITVTGVEVKPTNGSSMTFSLSSPLLQDLLLLDNGNVASLVNGAKVPAGSYEWIRLMLDTSAGKNYVLVCSDGTTACPTPDQIPLTIPSGAETGLKIVRGFTMPVGGAIHLVIDFNVDSSIVPIPHSTSWHMKPTLRVVETDTVGSIAGTISSAAMTKLVTDNATATACNAANPPTVYVYAAQDATTNVTPDDIFTTDPAQPVQPILTQLTTYNTADDTASFDIQWLASDIGYNNYTVAFTCDPDDPGADESATVPPTIFFATYATPVAVTTGATTTVNF